MNKNNVEGKILKYQNEATRRANTTLEKYRIYGVVLLVISAVLIIVTFLPLMGILPEIEDYYIWIGVAATGLGTAGLYYLMVWPGDLKDKLDRIKKINPADPKTYIDDPDLQEILDEEDEQVTHIGQ
jgi:hypothetical protein